MRRDALARALALLLIQLKGQLSWSCSVIAVGRDASATGLPMVGHSDDSGYSTTDLRLVRVPAKSWPHGSMRPLYNFQDGYPRIVSSSRAPEYAPVDDQKDFEPLGYIPQVEKTYGYWDMDYGAQNEVGLSIGESTCTAKTAGWPVGKPYGHTRAGIEELTKLSMERCATARCAIKLMGEVAVEQGFYSADSGDPAKPSFDGSSECLAIADSSPGELWIFNVMTGKNNASAIWAAQRIPANHVTAIGNAFTIRKMNLLDTDNFAYSKGITELAEEKGWWSPKEFDSAHIFDFFKAYGYDPPHSMEGERDILAYYSGRRMWRVFSLLSPDEGGKLDPNTGNLPSTKDPYPISVPAPKNSVTLQMVMNTYRDHYEGTPYDLTVGLAAGPYGNPNRGLTPVGLKGQWERAISMFRTTYSFVTQPRANGLSIMWFGLDAPHGTAYLPIYGAATKGAPPSYSSHSLRQSKFGMDSAWWAFNAVNQYCDKNFRMCNADVRALSSKVELQAMKATEEWEAEATKSGGKLDMDLLTEKSFSFAEEVVAKWWQLLWDLFSKYGRLVVTYNESENGESAHGPGSQEYPAWWLQSLEVGFSSWSPHGPYHGALLDVDPVGTGMAAMAIDTATNAFAWLPSISMLSIAIVMPMLSSAVAFKLGVRRGRSTLLADCGYVAAP
mmetsp:Transcript_27969/g.64550  ORF Transcript_27969/g.64550 Transcript_27969/m.64550 type:complete len:669 (+) Transcript_27969:53-2059(+)